MALLSREDEIRSAYITGLRNMHALEMSAIELTERQTERLEHYPEMKATPRAASRRVAGAGASA